MMIRASDIITRYPSIDDGKDTLNDAAECLASNIYSIHYQPSDVPTR